MEQLLTEIDDFCAVHGLTDTRFSELAMKDKPFLKRLREGRDIKQSTITRLRTFMASYAERQAA